MGGDKGSSRWADSFLVRMTCGRQRRSRKAYQVLDLVVTIPLILAFERQRRWRLRSQMREGVTRDRTWSAEEKIELGVCRKRKLNCWPVQNESYEQDTRQ